MFDHRNEESSFDGEAERGEGGGPYLSGRAGGGIDVLSFLEVQEGRS